MKNRIRNSENRIRNSDEGSEPEASLCCQDFDKCLRSCTPRGQWIAHKAAQREWQGLTENEIKHLWYEACQTNLELTSQLIVHLARNIEAKLKEKNGLS